MTCVATTGTILFLALLLLLPLLLWHGKDEIWCVVPVACCIHKCCCLEGAVQLLLGLPACRSYYVICLCLCCCFCLLPFLLLFLLLHLQASKKAAQEVVP
jgi:hypothetical protein